MNMWVKVWILTKMVNLWQDVDKELCTGMYSSFWYELWRNPPPRKKMFSLVVCFWWRSLQADLSAQQTWPLLPKTVLQSPPPHKFDPDSLMTILYDSAVVRWFDVYSQTVITFPLLLQTWIKHDMAVHITPPHANKAFPTAPINHPYHTRISAAWQSRLYHSLQQEKQSGCHLVCV